MFDISKPLVNGDSITFELEGETRTEKIKAMFWEERPKGGKEYCYETESGCIVPLSRVKSSEYADPALSLGQYDNDFGIHLTSPNLKMQIEFSDLAPDTKTVLRMVIEDDIESLGIAKTLIERKLKFLRKSLSDETTKE